MADWYSKNADSSTSLMPVARDEYEKKLLSRKPAASPIEEAAKSAVAENPSLTQVGQNAGASMASSAAQQGNMAGVAGGAMMMSGNPYLMGAGLGLQVLAGAEQNKREQEERERQAYNERIMNRQMIMSRIASQGIQ